MKKILFFFIIITLISCGNNKKEDYLTGVDVEINSNDYYFGKKNLSDTINHTFEIKNVSDNIYEVFKIAPSCGCTTSELNKTTIKKGEIIEIKVEYIPVEDSFGKVSKSIVVSDNSRDRFQVFYIKGEILE